MVQNVVIFFMHEQVIDGGFDSTKSDVIAALVVQAGHQHFFDYVDVLRLFIAKYSWHRTVKKIKEFVNS